MIIGIGTDLVSIDRIAAVITRHGDRFINRCFAGEEQISPVAPAKAGASISQDSISRDPGQRLDDTLLAAHYAKRWAAKEAAAKALGLGIDAGVYLRDIVVLKDARGAPRIELRAGAAAVIRGRCRSGAGRNPETSRDPGLRRDDRFRIHLSLSDDAGFALAFVVIEQ